MDSNYHLFKKAVQSKGKTVHKWYYYWNDPLTGVMHQKVCKGCSIGGDSFGNREGQLPKKKGRKYYECDIDYRGGTRNAKRIIWSSDGLIYYTGDHYKTFELLYGEPGWHRSY